MLSKGVCRTISASCGKSELLLVVLEGHRNLFPYFINTLFSALLLTISAYCDNEETRLKYRMVELQRINGVCIVVYCLMYLLFIFSCRLVQSS
jgi:hypothetical protein